MKNPLNSVETQTDKAVGNTDRSLRNQERAETIPKGSTPKRVEAGDSLPNNVGGDDIVQSLLKGKAVYHCNKCGKPKTIPDDFYGANRVCKDCVKERVSIYQKEEGLEIHRKANRKWGKTDSGRTKKSEYKLTDKGLASERRYSFRNRTVLNPEKVKARYEVRNAVRRGDLIKPLTCSKCGRTCKVEGHHADYSKPLVVEWLCRECHSEKDGHRNSDLC